MTTDTDIATNVVHRLAQTVREIAAEKPDEIYEQPSPDGCVYVFHGQPSCIVGHAAWRMGLIDASLEVTDSNVNIAGVACLLDHLKVGRTYDADYEFISDVQERQDAGVPWGQAVAEADEYAAGRRSSHGSEF